MCKAVHLRWLLQFLKEYSFFRKTKVTSWGYSFSLCKTLLSVMLKAVYFVNLQNEQLLVSFDHKEVLAGKLRHQEINPAKNGTSNLTSWEESTIVTLTGEVNIVFFFVFLLSTGCRDNRERAEFFRFPNCVLTEIQSEYYLLSLESLFKFFLLLCWTFLSHSFQHRLFISLNS